MGRSKFPGKPSKHCHRKRINVLPPTGELEHEKKGSSGANTGASKENKQEEEVGENECKRHQTNKSRPLNRRLSRKLSTTIRINSRQRNFISKIRNKAALKNNRSRHISKGHVHKGSSNFAGKFILPSRSVHSSRVIKPNKRFIDLNESVTIRKRSLVRLPLKSTEVKNNNFDSDPKDKLAYSNGHRVILRQARLKLPTHSGTNGPFSSNIHNGAGTIICSVCGAIRYYHFIKQARKFNIYSCESCRKFISKQIKRQNVGSGIANPLSCLLGQGNCHVPPVEKSQHLKITKCSNRSRCSACWLKMCLKTYHLPITLKQNLTQLLPTNMRSIDFSFSNSVPPILWQRNLENQSSSKFNLKQRPVRLRPTQQSQSTLTVATPEVKRQKIDLKGPRVKHVCRSASIVLGQPQATFGGDISDKKAVSDISETGSEKIFSSELSKVGESFKSDLSYLTDEDIVSSSGSCKSFRSSSEKNILSKRECSRSLVSFINKETSLPTTPTASPPKGIALDYPAEINIENTFKAGFPVITTKKNDLTTALCFICGSAGLESMLICSICCEPYHNFCAESLGMKVDSNPEWICLRCTSCHSCQGIDKSKITCSKCENIYHVECFSSSDDSGPKLLCKQCTRCHDCGKSTTFHLTSVPGNVPLCLNCLDKNKTGLNCGICQRSVQEYSETCKVLECSKCRTWVHSDCEKLTSEQYDILKLLPVSSNFCCSKCLQDSSHLSWRRSVQNFLYKNFTQVFRLLLKNKTAKMILKKTNFKENVFRSHVLTNNIDVDNNNYKDPDRTNSLGRAKELISDCYVNSLIGIKQRLCEYTSVKKFNNDMKQALQLYESEQLGLIYINIFQNVFPWFGRSHEEAGNVPLGAYNHIRLGHIQNINEFPLLPRNKTDSRCCALCQVTGDGLGNQEARLLYCGRNIWVHANCAYWSTNIYESIDNHLQNVTNTIECSKTLCCAACGSIGASVQCQICKSLAYHYMCARKAEFKFKMIDKACFCPNHLPSESMYVIKTDDEFELNRTIFVEQSSKESRSEAEKIICQIGSLCIISLGKIEPVLSDMTEYLIPSGFICTKLFWSIKEPWRLVSYVISTSIQNPNCTTLTVDKNFTINHSQDKECIERMTKELNDWRRVYEKKGQEVDSEDEEEKNGPELLSPELTDTILEDLPHDILDGISVQDIFQNFSYEDMLSLDNSNSESITDSLKKVEEEEVLLDSKSEFLIRTRLPPLSLTVSCKVNSTHPPVTKKRKLSKEISNNVLLLQVDGTFDDDTSSECTSPTEVNSLNTWGTSDEPVTCEKCQCTYRTRISYKRHLDSCEIFCTSESESENPSEFDQSNQIEEETLNPAPELQFTVQVNEQTQPVLVQAFESYQSQVHTSVVNMVPERITLPPPTLVPQPTQQLVQPTVSIPEQTQSIPISVPLCMGQSVTSQIVQPPMEFQQPQAQQISLQPMQSVMIQRPPISREPVVLQQIQPASTPSFMPMVDSFGQNQTSQGVQLLQISQQMQPQTQLLQISSDGNVIGIVPSIQPTTVLMQQPQQLVLDTSGTFGWTQQPQPQIYYGFETIVQNTVMQSQQFIPTPVPGVLAANSSYSTTTQVFQTSKLEPVLDVASNSFVLVNSSLEMPQQFPQNQSTTGGASQNHAFIFTSQPSTTQKPIPVSSQNCITLPTAPFVSDQNIPISIVPPIPKPPTSYNRPMNRVLPMPAPVQATKASKKAAESAKFQDIEKPQIKAIDEKCNFSKESLKVLELPKTRNKVEVLDYKVFNKSQSKIEHNSKIEEKSLKKIEPVQKLPKLFTYKPLKELEKVKIDMFAKSKKTFNMFEEEKSLKLDSIKNLTAVENRLKNFDNHLQQKVKIAAIQKKPQNDNKPKTNITTTKSLIEKIEKIEEDCSFKSEMTPLKNNLDNVQDGIQKQKLEIDSSLTTQVKDNIMNIQFDQSKSFINVAQVPIKQNIPLQIFPVTEPFQEVPHAPPMLKNTHSEKPLDMPQLDEMMKLEEHKDTKISEQQISCKPVQELSCVSILEEVAKPETSSKSMLSDQVGKATKSIDTINIASSKSELKKEPESSKTPSIIYTLENEDEGFKCSSTSISECWAKVLKAVQNARVAHNMPPLPTDGKHIKSVQVTGLQSSHIKYLVEQLPGASKCVRYKPLFKFMPHAQNSSDICAHGYGAIRCKPHKTRNTEPNDVFCWLSSKHRDPFTALDSGVGQSRRVNNFPMAMKFKNLKLTSKYSVGVYRSRIHGKGLFCLRDIEPGEMVIEYAGEVIRSILTDKREKFYNSKGIGCYMFRVDDNFVVDATMKGNAARFINHSCDPNCYSKVVEIMGSKHIIIFALRRILSGEELTYDYKFPFEEDKIPCTCGARRCRKFLN
ncbi:histone-lysine N-methyltransferase trithorax [Anthonomus grandis grandis]|uniref:histone-lysine N-methyltransferase trithorax n=1 Tax=Anthonomus grandis grandis TaxID=2921223 RepID=UPI0021665E03|nr:histone-lysine N-methyltransferase trithorax [Anthonomus grandis grandis]